MNPLNGEKRSLLPVRFPGVAHAKNPGKFPAPRSREVLTRRPSHPVPAPPVPEQPAWWSSVRTALLALTVQVLLRPARIGTLVLLGVMIGVMVVGAEGWWIVLGITLFQVAACALIVMWMDTRSVGLPPRQAERPQAERRRESPPSGLVRVPRPRRPRPDE